MARRKRRPRRPCRSLPDDEIHRLFVEHQSFSKAARTAGYTESAFRLRAVALGLRSPIAQNRVTDDDFRAAVATHRTAPAVALALSISRSQARARAKKLGIVLEHAPFGFGIHVDASAAARKARMARSPRAAERTAAEAERAAVEARKAARAARKATLVAHARRRRAEGATHAQIGAELGISRERVRQLLADTTTEKESSHAP